MIEWPVDGDIGECWAEECIGARELAEAVAAGKRSMNGSGGGSFLINEFGQVLVPSSEGDGQRRIVGRMEGQLVFNHPFDPGEYFSLGDDDDLEPGDPWPYPYVGMMYRLSIAGKIYFWREDKEGRSREDPPCQDQKLIQELLNIRGNSGCRFIVNPAGIVLTKCKVEDQWDGEECWEPYYAGRIDYDCWFEME